MSTVWARRALIALGLALAVLVTSPGTASASFLGSVTVPSGVGTTTVAAPTGLTTTGSTACQLLSTRYTVTVNWTASPTARVTAYRVTETVNGTARATQQVGTLSFTRTATKTLLSSAAHSFSVVAVTDYGWVSPVPATVSYTC